MSSNADGDNQRTWHATLPPRPQVFFGRDSETGFVLDSLIHASGAAARVAILGAPGIGKTSVAIAAAHHPSSLERFGDRRIFVQCDAVETADALLPLIGLAMGIKDPVARTLRAAIEQSLGASHSLLILDNFERPWELSAARIDTEELLATLCAINSLCLIVTLRGTERPAGVQWSRPFLPPLATLGYESAMQIFLAISDISEEDSDLRTLLHAVDGMPLALTLMANMAQYESCAALSARWTDMQTTMLRRGNAARSSSVDVSIEMSLSSARMQANTDAEKLLGVLSLLPDGGDISDIPAMAPSLQVRGRCISTLLQVALAYRLSPTRIRVLAPVRAFMLRNHPPSSPIFSDVLAYVIAQTELMHTLYRTADAKLIRHLIKRESTNYEAVLLFALRQKTEIEKAVIALVRVARVMAEFSFFSAAPISEALAISQACGAKALQARCLGRIAWIKANQDYNHNPIPALESAVQLASEADDPSAEVWCLLALADRQFRHDIDHIAAQQNAFRAISLAGQVKMTSDQAAGYFLLALLAQAHGKLDEAEGHLQQAIQLFGAQSTPDSFGLCMANQVLADITLTRGDLRRSSTMYAVAIEMATILDFKRGLHNLECNAGNCALRQSDIPEAIQHLDVAVKLARELKAFYEPQEYLLLTAAHLMADDRSRAISVIEGLRHDLLSTEFHEQSAPDATAVWGMGLVEMHDSCFNAARVYFQQAMALFPPSRTDIAARMLSAIGDTWAKQGEPGIARAHYIQAAVLDHQLGEMLCMLEDLNDLAEICLAEEDVSTAYALTMAILPKITWCGMKRVAAHCHFRLARVALARGDMDEAAEQVVTAEDLYTRAYDNRGAAYCEELRAKYRLSGT